MKAPRINDEPINPDTGDAKGFRRWSCRPGYASPRKMNEVLPLLHLHGLSTSDFGAALEQFLGSGAGLSPASITD